MTPFDTALSALPAPLQAHMRGWYEHTHDGGRSRTVHDLARKVAFLASCYVENSDVVCNAVTDQGHWAKNGSAVAHEVTLRGTGYEVTLRPDGTYGLSDTSGG